MIHLQSTFHPFNAVLYLFILVMLLRVVSQISLFQTDSVLLIMPLVALVDEDQPSGIFFHEFETTLDATLKIWMDDNLPAGAGRHQQRQNRLQEGSDRP